MLAGWLGLLFQPISLALTGRCYLTLEGTVRRARDHVWEVDRRPFATIITVYTALGEAQWEYFPVPPGPRGDLPGDPTLLVKEPGWWPQEILSAPLSLFLGPSVMAFLVSPFRVSFLICNHFSIKGFWGAHSYSFLD